MKPKKPIELDGRTGEGGGQLVRISVALAAVTSQPIRITHVRGNRSGGRGGGLKSQHVASIKWLAETTGAEVDGLSVGSHTLEFRPSLTPAASAAGLQQKGKPIIITADSPAASIMLVFQAVLPYLLFAADSNGTPIEIDFQGGTNVSFSLSYEYLDQVLLPTLESRFAGVRVERRLLQRSWSTGSSRMGSVWFRPLKTKEAKPEDGSSTSTAASAAKDKDFTIQRIDASILTPTALHAPLQDALARDLDTLFPGTDLNFKVVEESGHDARMYVLLVAHNTDDDDAASSPSSRRWGRDYMYSSKRKNKSPAALSSEISRHVSKQLYQEVALRRGAVDEYLQDQLVIFQALAAGRTSFPRGDEDPDPDEDDEEPTGSLADGAAADVDGVDVALRNLDLEAEKRLKRDKKTAEPFGDGSMHTKTARWVTSEILPGVKWFNRGSVCEGVGISFR
ncbi:RNA 3'-terminal phosphate cyclase-domain-containing protein [Apiospora marii]|uniref:RNA 3'-terminal phosphate cyclase-domain-containing protein n=1 Tax=Apiospora marii TaxID=335849 RepID=A0ABR1REB2_9PEZI